MKVLALLSVSILIKVSGFGMGLVDLVPNAETLRGYSILSLKPDLSNLFYLSAVFYR
jgi:hypothetical protein